MLASCGIPITGKEEFFIEERGIRDVPIGANVRSGRISRDVFESEIPIYG
jgi:hypothetical protein